MKRSTRFHSILKIAEKREKDAAVKFMHAQQQLQLYEDKLRQLKSFRNEYNVKAAQRDNEEITASSLTEQSRFMRQLDEGIAALERQLLQQKEQNLQDQDSWLAAKQRSDALDKLISRFRQKEHMYLIENEEKEVEDLCKPRDTEQHH